jgi:hypothetical protein
MFLQSLVEPSLSANVTSIRGQIQLYTESIDAFDNSKVALPTNLTIDGITTTLTAFPTPMESSISFARANRYTMYDSLDSDDESLVFQGFVSNATTTSCSNDKSRRSSSRKPKSTRRDDKSDSSKGII